MGQSFLTHDEKSSQSPSPDLLQFNNGGVSTPHSKFFGSLSSVKETSISAGSSRSPLEFTTDSERNLHVESCSSSGISSSPGSPPQLLASSSTTSDYYSYGDLVPTPILPGNVNRLREKFMEFDDTNRRQNKNTGAGAAVEVTVHVEPRVHEITTKNTTSNATITSRRRNVENIQKKSEEDTDTISELDCATSTTRFMYGSGSNRPQTASPSFSAPFCLRSYRGGLPLPPPSSTRSTRSSLHALSPTSRKTAHKHRVSFPTSPTTSAAYEKLDVIRSDNDLSDCFRQMTLAANSGNIGESFTSENPLVHRHRPRARPYVPQPRSVIIRAGYLPVLQTVDVISRRPGNWSASLTSKESGAVDAADAAASISPRNLEQDTTAKSSRSNECFITTNDDNIPKNKSCRKEDLLLVSSAPSTSCSTKASLDLKRNTTHVVTNQGVREKKEKAICRKTK